MGARALGMEDIVTESEEQGEDDVGNIMVTGDINITEAAPRVATTPVPQTPSPIVIREPVSPVVPQAPTPTVPTPTATPVTTPDWKIPAILVAGMLGAGGLGAAIPWLLKDDPQGQTTPATSPTDTDTDTTTRITGTRIIVKPTTNLPPSQ